MPWTAIHPRQGRSFPTPIAIVRQCAGDGTLPPREGGGLLASASSSGLLGNPAATHSGLIALLGLVIIGVLVLVASGLTLYWLSRTQAYFTWYMLHLVIGILGILAVVILAVEGVLDAAAAAILSSIVAYSVGASGNRTPQANGGGAPPAAAAAAAVHRLPTARVGTAYEAPTLDFPGISPPYHLAWAAARGSGLPPGLDFNGDTGAVSGTPTTAGSYTFTVGPATPGGAAVATFTLEVV
jgi:hypothetical protein